MLERRCLLSSTVGDFVWQDNNANGLQDAGEPGIDGVIVELHQASDNSVIANATTSGGGHYQFTNVQNGLSQYLALVPPTNFRPGPPGVGSNRAIDSDYFASSNRSASFSFATDTVKTDIDAGLVPPVRFEGVVWNDADVDGIRDAGESLRDGVTVALVNSTNSVTAASAVTANGGVYGIDAPAGSYRARVTAPTGLMFTRVDQGADDTIDSDLDVSGQTPVITPLPGTTVSHQDAGLVLLTAFRGTVFRDVYGDGVYDAGSFSAPGVDTTFAGWTVYADLDTDGVLDAGEPTTTSASNGFFELRLFPGTYTINAVPDPGYDLVNSTPAGRTRTLVLGSIPTVNLGFDPVVPSHHPSPLGPEFQLNAPTSTGHIDPALASNASGNTVAVWVNGPSLNGPIAARRFDAGGNPIGQEFIVSNSNVSNRTPQVAVEANGDFVVAWTTGSAVLARRYAADGTPRGAEFTIGDGPAVDDVRIAADPRGGFGIAWNEFFKINVRLYDANGVPRSGETAGVEDGLFGSYDIGGVAIDSSGAMTIAFDTPFDVYGRRFEPGGAPEGPSFRIGTNGNEVPTVAINPAGDRLFVWTFSGTVFGRLYAPENTPRAPQFRISTSDVDTFSATPVIAAGADGYFGVVWKGSVFARRGPLGQLVGPNGELHGREFRLFTGSSNSSNSEQDPTVAALPGGRFLAAWESARTVTGSSSPNIFAQQFETYTNPAQVGDFVWADVDQDGIQDPTEPGIPNISLELYNEFGSIVDTTVSGANGFYRFPALKPGALHQIKATPTFLFPVGSPIDQGGDDTKDNDLDPGTGRTHLFAAAAAGTFDPTVDIGLLDLPPQVASVSVSGSGWTPAFKQFLQSSGLGDSFGFRITDAAQLDELPWTNIDRISIRFDEQVNVAADDLVVRGVNNAVYPLAAGGFSYDSASATATWTLAGPLPNDKILLDLDGDPGTGVTDANGQPLDGNRNGTGGDDLRYRLNVLPGDVNRSGGSIVGSDVTLVRNAQNIAPGSNGYSVFFDVNGTGSIFGSDVTLVRNRQGTSLPAGEPVAPASIRLATFPGTSGGAKRPTLSKELAVKPVITLLSEARRR